MEEAKICSKCREEKTLECFHNDRSSKDGKFYQCKSCRKEYKRKYREKKRKERYIIEHDPKNHEMYKGEKTCGKCGEIKDHKEFCPSIYVKENKPRCRKCQYDINVKYKIKRIKKGEMK